jgi:plasmid stabilization system protein ParE
MRRTVFAPSFDQEVEDIAVYVEQAFGEARRRQFLAELGRVCASLASFPGLGLGHHGYATTSMGFVCGQNWIFFEYDDEGIRFLHMVDGRRDKKTVAF